MESRASLQRADGHPADAGFVPRAKLASCRPRTGQRRVLLEYGTKHLEIHRDAWGRQKVLIVDDSRTGGTVMGTIELAHAQGEVVGLSFLASLFLKGRDPIADQSIHKRHPVDRTDTSAASDDPRHPPPVLRLFGVKRSRRGERDGRLERARAGQQAIDELIAADRGMDDGARAGPGAGESGRADMRGGRCACASRYRLEDDGAHSRSARLPGGTTSSAVPCEVRRSIRLAPSVGP